ncbi:MAG: ABC transporter permease [Fimbriimonadales bacterium]
MNPTFIVMKKELKELFRDKRVRTNAVIMPGVMMLVFLALFNFIAGVTEKENQVVHVVKTDNQLIRKLKDEKVKVIEIADVAEGEKLIRSGKARLVLNFEPDFDAKFSAAKPTKIQAYYDPQQQTGQITLGVVSQDLAALNKDKALEVLKQHNLDPQSLNPATVEEKKVQVGKSETSDFIVGLLPYLIVIYAFYGAFGSGSDAVAGEKEKYTLETLLIAPVKRSQIAFGKFLSLAVICFCSSFSALLGVIVAGSSHSSMYSKIFAKGLGLNLGQIGTMLIVLIPTVAFFASLLIAVSAYAKNTREAQSYMGLISLAGTVVAPRPHRAWRGK